MLAPLTQWKHLKRASYTLWSRHLFSAGFWIFLDMNNMHNFECFNKSFTVWLQVLTIRIRNRAKDMRPIHHNYTGTSWRPSTAYNVRTPLNSLNINELVRNWWLTMNSHKSTCWIMCCEFGKWDSLSFRETKRQLFKYWSTFQLSCVASLSTQRPCRCNATLLKTLLTRSLQWFCPTWHELTHRLIGLLLECNSRWPSGCQWTEQVVSACRLQAATGREVAHTDAVVCLELRRSGVLKSNNSNRPMGGRPQRTQQAWGMKADCCGGRGPAMRLWLNWDQGVCVCERECYFVDVWPGE